MDELKCCPCCGYEAAWETMQVRKGWEAYAHCNGCLLSMNTITYDTEEEAAKAAISGWNRRADENSLLTLCGEWNSSNKLPTDDETKVIECAAIVRGTRSGTIRVEETEYRHGEWDISNAWDLLAWRDISDCAADENRWIPVSEGLPEKDGDVWAWVEGGNMILYFAKNGDDVDEYGLFDIRGKTNVFCNLDDGEWFIIDSVTHWCPLPEPPKGAKR